MRACWALRHGMEPAEVPGAGLPDAALVMLHTRMLNEWLHTHYSLEEVAGMPEMLFMILSSLRQGMNPKEA